jgi:hypothetical protein
MDEDDDELPWPEPMRPLGSTRVRESEEHTCYTKAQMIEIRLSAMRKVQEVCARIAEMSSEHKSAASGIRRLDLRALLDSEE